MLFWSGVADLGGVAAATAAIAATVITLGVSVLGLFTPLMDESDSGVAWAFSWAIKLIKSPVFTIIGLFVVAGLAIFRQTGRFPPGRAVRGGWCGHGRIDARCDRLYPEWQFRLEWKCARRRGKARGLPYAYCRALGERGFYVTYVTFGSVFAWATGGEWNALDNRGCGNPFEKHAYTYYNPWVGGRARTRFLQGSVEFGVFIRNEIL